MTRAPLVDAASPTRASRAATARSTTRRSAGASPTRARGDVPARGDGRDRRERRRALATSRARIRTRSRCARSARWAAAQAAGRFADELIPVGELDATSTRGRTRRAEKLATLRPAFRQGGTVTAGNSSGINDGAAALVIASEERARALGAEPLGAFVGSAVAGVDPRVMGIGPIPAVRKLLARTGFTSRTSTWSS